MGASLSYTLFTMSKMDQTAQKIANELAKLRKEVAEKQVVITALEKLVGKETKTPAPSGFVLTKAIAKALEKHPGEFVTIETIVQDISLEWHGYTPDRRNVQIMLNDLSKKGKAKKEGGRGGRYSLAAPQ